MDHLLWVGMGLYSHKTFLERELTVKFWQLSMDSGKRLQDNREDLGVNLSYCTKREAMRNSNKWI